MSIDIEYANGDGSTESAQQTWEREFETKHWSELPIIRAALDAVWARALETLTPPHKRKQSP